MTRPSLATTFPVFLKIGLLSFGGPAAQISLMHRSLVEEQNWLDEPQFLNALSFCMLLPGPEAMQLATYSGWRLHGVRGGLMAGLLFVLPGALVIFLLAALYALFGQLPLMATLFLGIKAAVLIIVIEALLRVSKRALKRPAHWAIAALAFVAIFFFAAPFPLIILAAALYGAAASSPAPLAAAAVTARPSQTLVTVTLGLIIWLAPLALLVLLAPNSLLSDIGWFFSKLAIVTFGGAYAVLAYMAQDVVTHFGWLTAGEMMDALGLAETTPGPLILVTQFVATLAATHAGGLGHGLMGGLVALWATFAPCFLWIFAGAPYIEWIAAQRRLSGALAAITAAVVGVMLNLSLWFSLHVFFTAVTQRQIGPLTLWLPDPASLDARVIALAALCAYLLLRRHMALGWVLCLAALASWGLSLLTS